MTIMLPIIEPNAKVDFYAGNSRTFEILLPLWEALDGRQGTFFVSRQVRGQKIKTQTISTRKLDGFSPLVVASHKDLRDVYVIGEERPFVSYETNYSNDFNGLMSIVSLFLCADDKSFRYRKIINKNTIRVKDAEDTIKSLLDFIKGKEPQNISKIGNRSVGIIYMAFGSKALSAVGQSIASLHRLGYDYPVTVIGDTSDNLPYNFIEWKEESPFDVSKRRNFQFRAGRIKPFLYKYSPYDYTLYIDADTRFLQPIHEGFELLADHDLVVTEEKLTLAGLYNKSKAGWEINLIERDVTVVELGNDDQRNFVNSGVFFFRKNKATKKLFQDWHEEWLRFQEWDEQLALMRAIHSNPKLKIKFLPVQWNDPFPNQGSYIFHNYGRGVVRMNYEV